MVKINKVTLKKKYLRKLWLLGFKWRTRPIRPNIEYIYIDKNISFREKMNAFKKILMIKKFKKKSKFYKIVIQVRELPDNNTKRMQMFMICKLVINDKRHFPKITNNTMFIKWTKLQADHIFYLYYNFVNFFRSF